jgi:hypothetical protein
MKEEWQVKIPIQIWLFSFYVPASSFCRYHSQIQLTEYFSQKQKEQRHMQLGYTDYHRNLEAENF